jgi:hypothetical protein
MRIVPDFGSFTVIAMQAVSVCSFGPFAPGGRDESAIEAAVER